MNPYDAIYTTDEEFVPFLVGLGVETYSKSFEWMLNDPDFSGVLRWLHRNLDSKNALTAREDCRYQELMKKGALLPKPVLEATITTLQQQYEGLPYPGDQDALQDMQMEVQMFKERLEMLETHETVLEKLKENDLCNDLNCEITKLHASLKQSKEDEEFAQEECLALAEELQGITNGIVDVIGDALDLYSDCHLDKETSNQFFYFGPWETYRQSQALFTSYFDVYITKKFLKKQADIAAMEQELRSSLAEAQSMEKRLTDAVIAYIESKAELAGEQAKLAFVSDYDFGHSQIAEDTLHAQSFVDSMELDESLLEQRLRDACAAFVRRRARAATDAALREILDCRQDILRDLTHLSDLAQQASALDTVLYYALRHELRAVEDVVQFAGDLKDYLVEEEGAVRCRMDSMAALTHEHDTAHARALRHEPAARALGVVLSCEQHDVPARHASLLRESRELGERARDALATREIDIDAFKSRQAPLRAYLWDGCTKQPNCRHRGVSSLIHTLKRDMNSTDCKLVEASSQFIGAKTGDSNGLRKFWQWFLTDPTKMFNALKDAQTKSYS